MTAIGEVDEANSAIGVAIAALSEGELSARLRMIQNELFDLGADIATPGEDGRRAPHRRRARSSGWRKRSTR